LIPGLRRLTFGSVIYLCEIKNISLLVQGSNKVCIHALVACNLRKETAENSCTYDIFVTGVQLPSIDHDTNT
jgi:hypothetical protein